MTPATLGSYPIERELGRGGMGVVYLGRDPRLDRLVAIKVVPAALAKDPDTLARFEREARLLAAVNHPNIASIYGVEEADGQRILVMEYVPGDTLAERVARGPMPVDAALDVGRQIAAAIEAAHEGGIIHRDLKPGNVKITPDDVVKVLDFGLAKGGAASATDIAQSPTLTYSPTGIGVILGTAGYMSPEQARGKLVDRRADIWAFGCVLFECLTGRKAFEGETVSDTIARIIEREPDWNALPAATPPGIRELLRRCLEKDIKKRQRDIGDVRLHLEEAIALRSSSLRTLSSGLGVVPESTAWPWRPGLSWLGAAVLVALGAAIGIGVWSFAGPTRDSATGATTSLSVTVPASIRAMGGVRFIANSDMLVVRGLLRRADGTEEPRPRIFSRRLGSFDFTPIPGTEGVEDFTRSPDGKWLAVVTPITDGRDRRVMKVAIDGSSPAVPLIEWQDGFLDMQWLEDGDLLIQTESQKKFFRVPTGGGAAKAAVPFAFDGKDGALPLFESEIPGTGQVLMTVESWGVRGYQQDIWILDSKTGKARLLVENGGRPEYHADSGHLLFSRGSVLMAVPIDPAAGTTRGDAVALFDGLRSGSWSNGAFGVSSDGHLVFEPGGRLGFDRRVVTVTPSKDVAPFITEARAYEEDLIASSDGRQIAAVIPNARGTYEVWTAAVDRPGVRRTLAFSNADASSPRWSPDRRWLAFTRFGRDKDDGVYIQRTDEAADAGANARPVPAVLAKVGVEYVDVSDWSAGGRDILITRVRNGSGDVLAVPMSATGEAGAVKELRATPASEGGPRSSPDGRFLAFESDESGRFEVYVSALSGGALVGQPVLVSNGGGTYARWSRDSRRLYFAGLPNDRVMVATIDTTAGLRASGPTLAWDLRAFRIDRETWDVLPDGLLIGVQRSAAEDDTSSYSIVLNWLSSVKGKLK